MKNSNALNYKTAAAVIFLIALIILMQVYGSSLKDPLKNILESKWLSIFLWAYIAGTFVTHKYLYSSNALEKDSFIYKHFGSYADTLFGIATYGFGSSTSLALLKGLYLQVFYEESYFNGFAAFDLASMFLLTSFLLVYCVFNTTVLFKSVLFHSEMSPIETR